MKISQTFAESNTGRKRRRNEDSYVCEPPLFAVADGMGGAQAGEVASSLAAAALREGAAASADRDEAHVVRLIQAANKRVHQRALDDSSASGMGTTITVALFDESGTVVIGHVGDSRAYVLRDGRLEQLTDDHSLVAELVRRGELSPEEAEVHPQRSVITRALGTEADVDIDAFSVQARSGDVYLLCSDGLTTMVDGETINAIVQRHRLELATATHQLIAAANDRGGEDNITAVLFSVGEGEDLEHTAEFPVITTSSDSEDEDTLHPEDRVPAIDLEHGRSSDTMIVPAAAIRGAIEERQRVEVLGPEPENTPLGRLVLASLVIVALVALIVLLVLQGLPR